MAEILEGCKERIRRGPLIPVGALLGYFPGGKQR